MDVCWMMWGLPTEKVVIIRAGVKFIEMMLPLKNDYDSLQDHRVITVMTEVTDLFGMFLLSKDPVGNRHPLFVFSGTAGTSYEAPANSS